jgi:non-specific serine/threonine protein kinase/serine/threonine-protein kinase
LEPLASSGQTIDAYVLHEPIGVGGMGEVWKAEQTAPVRRTVALKLIKPGMDSHEVLTRFEAERQALALMDHPCIAKVFDAGTTPEGRPWFAMEYVQGIPITDYCDRRRLSTKERLRLFQRACEGVQHAHQKAILHRDLKPSNVLVADLDGKPLPKIIDFGVAKATTQKLTERTMYTSMGQLIGTPEYMSPEQAELTGEDVDTRTDVYSLGVVLYQLLTGALPFDSKTLRDAGFDGIRRMIREQDPPRPSTKLSTLGDDTVVIASRRGTAPRRLISQLRGDLDWIVMRSLEKDRNRRYGSPQELAQDIDRHLLDQPVLAGPPSAAYRTRKFLRRNRLGVGIAATALAVLVAFAATMTVQSQRIATQRDRANREAEASQRVTEFLTEILGDIDPHRFGNLLFGDIYERVEQTHERRGSTASEIREATTGFKASLSDVSRTDVARNLLDIGILARAGQAIKTEFGEDPLIAARLHHTIGQTYIELGLYESAQEHFEKAIDIRSDALGKKAAETLWSLFGHALARYHGGAENEENEVAFREIYKRTRKALGDEDRQTLESLHWVARFEHMAGRYVQADSLQSRVFEASRRVLGPQHILTLEAASELGMVAQAQENWTTAESLRVYVYETAREHLGPDDPRTLDFANRLIVHYDNREMIAESLALAKDIAQTRERVQGLEHDKTLSAKERLVHLYGDAHLHRYDAAVQLLKDILSARRQQLGPLGSATLDATIDLASLLLELQSRTSADSLVDAAVAAIEAEEGKRGAKSLRFRYQWAEALSERDQHEDAARILDTILPLQRALLGDEHAHVGDSVFELGQAYRKLEQFEKAEPLLLESLETARKATPTSLTDVIRAARVDLLYRAWGKSEQAVRHAELVLDMAKEALGPDARYPKYLNIHLANALVEAGRIEDARPYAEKYLEAFRAYAAARTRDLWSHALFMLTVVPEPFRDVEEALDYAIRANEATNYAWAHFLHTLALAYFENGRFQEAVETQKMAIERIPVPTLTRSGHEETLAEYETALGQTKTAQH